MPGNDPDEVGDNRDQRSHIVVDACGALDSAMLAQVGRSQPLTAEWPRERQEPESVSALEGGRGIRHIRWSEVAPR